MTNETYGQEQPVDAGNNLQIKDNITENLPQDFNKNLKNEKVLT